MYQGALTRSMGFLKWNTSCAVYINILHKHINLCSIFKNINLFLNETMTPFVNIYTDASLDHAGLNNSSSYRDLKFRAYPKTVTSNLLTKVLVHINSLGNVAKSFWDRLNWNLSDPKS